MSRFSRVKHKPHTFQSHLIEDELERIIVAIRTKLAIYEQLTGLDFADTSPAIRAQIAQIRQEVIEDLTKLQRTGYSIPDVLGRLDRLVYRKELIEATRVIQDAAEKGESHRIADLFDEDSFLNSRIKQYQREPDDGMEDGYLSEILQNDAWLQAMDIDYDNAFEDRSDEDDINIQQDEDEETYQPSEKMLGNQKLREIERAMLDQNFDEAKRIAKMLLQDFINKKRLKKYQYDASPKTKKFAFILEKLFPNVSSLKKSAEQFAFEIIQAS